jgi:uncharacterized protein (TIGR03437 family)
MNSLSKPSRRILFVVLSLNLTLLFLVTTRNNAAFSRQTEVAAPIGQQTRTAFSLSPAGFVANASVFAAHGLGYRVALTPTQVSLTLRQPVLPKPRRQRLSETDAEPPPQSAASVTVQMKLVEADPTARAETLNPLPGQRHYFKGKEQTDWQTGLQTFAKVQFRDVYPGIDAVYYGNQQQLEYDFVVWPGADPGLIRLTFTGVSQMRIDADGELILTTAQGELRQRKPIIYQLTETGREMVTGGYVWRDERTIGFTLGEYDRRRPLIIDPVIVYSTLIGGGGFDSVTLMTTDAAGNVYLVGETSSDDLPTRGGAQPVRSVDNPSTCIDGCTDAFVIKLNAADNSVAFATYLGGKLPDFGFGLAVANDGSVYLTGWTESLDFPTTRGAVGSVLGGRRDAFVARLSADGSTLLYSTLLGGLDSDRGFYVAVDAAGNAYVTGRTQSNDFPTVQPFQVGLGNPFDVDGFVTKLNPYGTELLYSTYLGGSDVDQANAIAVDAEGNAYIVGETISADFPTTPGAYQTELSGGSDVFVTKLDASGTQTVYSTFVGGDSGDTGTTLALDAARNVYVSGISSLVTGAHPFPLVNPLQRGGILYPGLLGAALDAIVFKLNPAGDRLLYATFLGGEWIDDSSGQIAVDARGRIYLSGTTASSNFPVTPGAFQNQFGGGASDGWMAVIDPAQTGWAALVYSSYIGGHWHDYGQSAATDAQGNLYVAGLSRYPLFDPPNNFPLVNPLQPAAGLADGFLAKVALASVNPGDATPPVVAITAPVEELLTTKPRIDLKGTASDNLGITRVTWRNERGSIDLTDDHARGVAIGTATWEAKGVWLAHGLNRFVVTAIDAAGNAAKASVTVRFTPEYLVNTVAGNGMLAPHREWIGESQQALTVPLESPLSIAVDLAGNLLFTDSEAGAVRKVSPAGIITNFAGAGDLSASLGDGGPATRASLIQPFALAVDQTGNVYITDAGLSTVRKVAPNGIITTVAGVAANEPGRYAGDGGPATQARLNNPRGVAVDAAGNVYIADTTNHRVRKVNRDGIITTVAGTGQEAFGGDGGPATQAQLALPGGLALDTQGNLLIIDYGNQRIRRLSPAGIITTIAGGSTSGDENIPATQAGLGNVFNLAVDLAGNIYLADAEAHLIRRIKPDGIIDSIAGLGGFGFGEDGGAALVNRLAGSYGVAVDRLQRVYFISNRRIRVLAPVSASDALAPQIHITAPAVASVTTQVPSLTVSGTASDESGVFQVRWSNARGGGGVALGTNGWTIPHLPLQSGSNRITVTALDAARNTASAVLEVNLTLDTTPPVVTFMRPTMSDGFTTNNSLLNLGGTASDANGICEIRWQSRRGSRGQAQGATTWQIENLLLQEGVNEFTVIAYDATGNAGTRTLRVTYQPDFIISTYAGKSSDLRTLRQDDGRQAAEVTLYFPRDVAVDGAGNVYIAENESQRIRKVAPNGVITTLPGITELGGVTSLATDGAGNLYFSSGGLSAARIRKISPSGIITVIAGGGTNPPQEPGPAAGASLIYPAALTCDSAGNLYFLDGFLNGNSPSVPVRKITPAGQLSTVAGKAACDFAVSGDGGPATEASFCNPRDLAVDRAGNLYIAEQARGRVRKVTPAGIISTVAGSVYSATVPPGSLPSVTGDGGPATAAKLYDAGAIGVDAAGNLFIAENFGARLRKVSPAGIISTVVGYAGLGVRGDGGAASWAMLNEPGQMTFDVRGNLYICDQPRVRKLAPFLTSSRSVASVSAASYSPAMFAAESIVATFGSGLASATQVASSTPLPTTMAGVTVKLRDSVGAERTAPLFFVSPTQINFLVPVGTRAGAASVTVSNGDNVQAIGEVQINNVAPGLFTANASGQGVAVAVALRVQSDGSQSFEPVAVFDPAQNRFVARPLEFGPASEQLFLLLFGTGIRQRASLIGVHANFGASPAEVLFAGAQGGLMGLDQINLRLPRDLAGKGDTAITLLVENKPANPVRVTFK